MKIVPKRKAIPVKRVPIQTENQTKPKKGGNKLPPDEYKDEIPQKKIPVDEKFHIVISVKRAGEDGLPHLDIRRFQTTEVYTGYTKAGINIPIEKLPELVQTLYDVIEECELKELLD